MITCIKQTIVGHIWIIIMDKLVSLLNKEWFIEDATRAKNWYPLSFHFTMLLQKATHLFTCIIWNNSALTRTSLKWIPQKKIKYQYQLWYIIPLHIKLMNYNASCLTYLWLYSPFNHIYNYKTVFWVNI